MTSRDVINGYSVVEPEEAFRHDHQPCPSPRLDLTEAGGWVLRAWEEEGRTTIEVENGQLADRIRWGSLKWCTWREEDPSESDLRVRSENSKSAGPSTLHYSCSLGVGCLSATGMRGEAQEKGVQPNKRMTSSTRSVGELMTPLMKGWVSLGETAGAHGILSLNDVLLHDSFTLPFYLSLWGESL